MAKLKAPNTNYPNIYAVAKDEVEFIYAAPEEGEALNEDDYYILLDEQDTPEWEHAASGHKVPATAAGQNAPPQNR